MTTSSKALLLAAALACVSCGREPRAVRVAMKGDADRARLLRGFSGFEGVGSERPFAWIETTNAKVALGHLTREGEVELRVEAWPFNPPGLPPQRMVAWVNGSRLAEWTMADGPRDYVVRFPARVLSRGNDELTLAFDRAVSPKGLLPGSGDARTLAAAVSLVEVRVTREVTKSSDAGQPGRTLPCS